MPLTLSPDPSTAARRDQQLRNLRFIESLQDALAGCRDISAVYDSAVHRVAGAFAAEAACLAAWEPISGTIEIVHRAGPRAGWDTDLLQRVIDEEHSITVAGVLAVPLLREDAAYREGRVWGVLAVRRGAKDGSVTFTSAERRTLRAAGERVAAEMERRRAFLLDDVVDGLLRKTKPIDVYTHALRELRRFIRYDHSASVMTVQRGMAQITVRAEKVITRRETAESLVDSPRRGRPLRLTVAQARFLGRLRAPIVLTDDGEGYRLQGEANDPDAAGLWRVFCLNHTSGEGSILCYPLIFGGHTLGVLRLAARRPGAFDPVERHARLLDRFARLLAVTLYRSELYHQSDRQLQAIKQMGRIITEPRTVEEICREVLELALRTLHAQAGAVGLLSAESRLELAAHQGCTLAQLPILTVGQGISGTVVATGASRAVPDVLNEPAYVVFNARVRSEVAVPIIYDRDVMGFLNVESFEDGRFREEDEEVISFLEALANQAAIAIKTAQLHFEAVRRLGPSMDIDPSLTVAGLQDLLIEELRDKIEQLAAANDRLATANRAKSEFLARMSHDLRGPLNVIVGLTNLLTDPSVGPSLTPEKRHESLGVIRSSGEVLSSLIGNILDLSALEAGKVKLALTAVDAPAAFRYAHSMAETLATEAQHDLSTEMSVDPSISTITVDEEKFMRILLNLISNAVKFTPSGGRLTVSAAIEGDAADCLHLTVADSGVGIPPELHESIFDPFERVEGTKFGQRHGSGLGLAVVRQLVELHGGRVWVESVPGEGSTFHVLLPQALGSCATEPIKDAVPEPLQAAPPDAPERRSRGLVLVVEDTEAHMNLMRLAVTSRGYTMHGVTSGEEALAWLDNHRPDVILLDMQLPGIDGFTVATHVRDRVETHAIPLIAVTADALAANEERARASGCDAYLTKPIDLATLLASIDAVTAGS
jgi:signal transduction histidine kinase/ActR/RegA family two-component response regulator